MSNVRSGFPGIWIAVRHLVCVVVGAPGPVHGAAAAGVSDATPSNAVATVPEKYETNFLYLVMSEPSHEKSRFHSPAFSMWSLDRKDGMFRSISRHRAEIDIIF